MQAVHGQIPILVRTIGTSSQLLEIISDPPPGSVNLFMQVCSITFYVIDSCTKLEDMTLLSMII